jgi:hypothetical protein
VIELAEVFQLLKKHKEISLASDLLNLAYMSSMDNIYSKLSPNFEPTAFASLHPEPHADSPRQIGREVAHDLNGHLAVMRLCAEQMLTKHGENQMLRPQLVMLTEKLKAMEALIRQSTFPRTRPNTTVSASSLL